MKHLITAALIGLLTLFALPAMATNPLASDISGKVVDAQKQPIVGAMVTITHLETGRVVVKRTNKKGRYLALNLRSDGHYKVRIDGPRGFVEFKPDTVLLGHRMRRNAVIAPAGTSDHWGWQWDQRGLVAEQTYASPLSIGGTIGTGIGTASICGGVEHSTSVGTSVSIGKDSR